MVEILLPLAISGGNHSQTKNSLTSMSSKISNLPSGRVSPVGTRHKLRSRQVLPKQFSRLSDVQQEEIEKEIKLLPNLIKTHYTGWKDGARDFQLDAIEAQVLGEDVLLHAATGSGKTGIAAAPHLLPSSKGKVTLFVSPLLALQEEQVRYLSQALLFVTSSQLS